MQEIKILSYKLNFKCFHALNLASNEKGFFCYKTFMYKFILRKKIYFILIRPFNFNCIYLSILITSMSLEMLENEHFTKVNNFFNLSTSIMILNDFMLSI